jgi:hypothetical protein
MMSFQRRLKDAQAKTSSIPSWRDIHNLALSHATWQWRWYLTFWESKLAALVRQPRYASSAWLISPQVSKAHVSRVQGRTELERMPVLTIEYSDFQDVQLIHDRMNAAKYILNSNTGICERLEERLLGSPETGLFAEELRLQSNRADNLLERTKSGSTLVRQTCRWAVWTENGRR